MLIEAGANASKYMQELNFRGKSGKFFYKTPNLMLFDETMARKLMEKEYASINHALLYLHI